MDEIHGRIALISPASSTSSSPPRQVFAVRLSLIQPKITAIISLMLTQELVLQKLKECYDPEIPVNIVDLGLIYNVIIAENKVKVRMTLTSPGCPLHASMAESVKRKIREIKGIGETEVEIVWQPPWTPQRMAPELRRRLGWP